MRNCRSRESDIRCTRLYSIYMNSIVVGWCAITLIVLLKSIYIGLVVEEEVVVVEWNRRHFGANHRRKNLEIGKNLDYSNSDRTSSLCSHFFIC